MKIAFLDRDGTLIYEPPDGLVRPEDFRMLPGVIDGLKKLRKDGFTIVMITNQDFNKMRAEEYFGKTQDMLIATLEEEGVAFDHIFMCPHAEYENCACRKPRTGMVDEFLKMNVIDRSQSFVCGDRLKNDGGLATNLGVRYVAMASNGQFPL